ncbi:heat-inducible transcriptional repressor HrcA [Georgenia sp. 311]|uniref:Heat-inducible transcription repressor HrcA n=1 Tax=Georgenia wutianyii TaxID=2585135 RepID=A0ABX5VMH4_9MICO|nr:MULTISPECIES: heat-inducible transcriptional repressor HrcA [Georgenia]QDB78896.1 heat-inducible transcriptional repressor HrcA [Georgenia wutianyii]TNC18665.1 heat-inducible transcriptional repressor HrcA [Georgenia sp. 311]
MAQDRQLDVLRAIVEDYVETREPVGSKALVERHALGVSPATIRNDMAMLEERGYIHQPHTSAGRVPTDKGYRLFVDQLSTLKPLTAAERRAIAHLLDGAVDLDDVVERTVRLLAQLTHQVAVVQYPSLRNSALRHVELVPLSDRRLLVVVITDSGRVEQRSLEVPTALDPVVLAELRARINAGSIGRRVADIGTALEDTTRRFAPEHRPLVSQVVGLLTETLRLDAEERIVMAGTANLARADVDFSRTIGPVLEALEEQVVLLRLLEEMSADDAVAVSIGQENQHESLSEASIVATAYGGGNEGVARLGVLGPTRMDYPSAMSSVRAVARYLSRILKG